VSCPQDVHLDPSPSCLDSEDTITYDDGEAARGQSTLDAVNYSDHRGQMVLADYYDGAISW
jgi:hypothetical protein